MDENIDQSFDEGGGTIMSPQIGAGHGTAVCDGYCVPHERVCVLGVGHGGGFETPHGCVDCLAAQVGKITNMVNDPVGPLGSDERARQRGVEVDADAVRWQIEQQQRRDGSPDGGSLLGELRRQQQAALRERLGDGAFEVGEPDAVPVVAHRARVAVGGSLHGRVVNVPITSTVLYCEHDVSVEVVPPTAPGAESVTFRATQRFELYEVRDHARTSNGNVGLIIAAELLKSTGSPIKGSGLAETIVEALGIAAGVHGRSRAIVRH